MDEIERYNLNKFGQFRNRSVEADFIEYDRTASLNTVRTLLLIMGIAFALFVFSDFHFYGDLDVFPFAVGLRLSALLIAVLSFFFLGKFKRYENTLKAATLVQLTVFSFYLLNMYILQGTQLYLQFMTVVVFFLVVFLTPNTWKNCLVAGIIIWLGYTVSRLTFLDFTKAYSFIPTTIYLGLCLVCCSISIHGREKNRRKQFAAEKRLEHMSITDSLTGISNRDYFERVLSTWIKNMRHNPFSLLLFDIDDFKKVNDRFGHTTGDNVLVGTTETVSAHIRDEDVFARWGGEEFVILFSDTNLEQAGELAERLRKRVEVHLYPETGRVTISIGVAEYKLGETIMDFVNRADEKMYEAKRAGKNQVKS